ncbi:hypothetical protein AAVH_21415 [Aphelenchoides avenae]|nr:hypothetical protein AAVH_21415 [Aphelenchus avenae]
MTFICYQNFMVRYMDYDKKTYEFFVDYLAQYLFQTVGLYGFCLPIAFPEQMEQDSRIRWAVDSLETIRRQIFDSMDVFKETPSDQPFTQKIDVIRQQLIPPIHNSTGFDRLQKLEDHISYIVNYFGWLGSLFTTGILGRCEKVGQEECVIYVGADGSKSLQQDVLAVFREMYAFNEAPPNSEDPFVRVFAGKVDEGKALAKTLAVRPR